MDAISEPTFKEAFAAPSPEERRKGNRLLAYWRGLRAERPFPAIGDLEPSDLGHLWRFCFIALPRGETLRFSYIGESLRTSYGVESTDGLPPTVRAMIEQPIREAARRLEPVSADGSVHNPWGDELRYRAIVLPLGEDRDSVSHVLGLVDFIAVRRDVAVGITVITQCAPGERPREGDS